jgi:hypothetical protein
MILVSLRRSPFLLDLRATFMFAVTAATSRLVFLVGSDGNAEFRPEAGFKTLLRRSDHLPENVDLVFVDLWRGNFSMRRVTFQNHANRHAYRSRVSRWWEWF